MALFDDKEAFSYDIVREGDESILNINSEHYSRLPSIENDAITMSKTVDILAEAPTVTKIVFQQKRNYEYDYTQTQLLVEIAKLYTSLMKNKELTSYTA